MIVGFGCMIVGLGEIPLTPRYYGLSIIDVSLLRACKKYRKPLAHLLHQYLPVLQLFCKLPACLYRLRAKSCNHTPAWVQKPLTGAKE